MVVIVIEQLEHEITGNIAGGPALRVWFVATERQAADFLLEIGAAVGVADGRRVAGQAVHLLGDDVLVLDRLERHIDTGHGADLARPLPGAIDHLFAGDITLVGLHRENAAVLHVETGDAHVFEDLRAMHARALGQRLGDVRWTGLAIGGQPAGADKVIDLHQREHRPGFLRRQQMHVHAEALRGGGEPPVFGPAVLIGGEPKAARHLPAGLKAGFLVEPLVEIDGVFEHLGDRCGGAQLPNEACSMPGRAGGQLALFQKNDICLVIAGKMIGRRTTDDAATDNDDLGPVRECHDDVFP
jgi:hypothetical protein